MALARGPVSLFVLGRLLEMGARGAVLALSAVALLACATYRLALRRALSVPAPG